MHTENIYLSICIGNTYNPLYIKYNWYVSYFQSNAVKKIHNIYSIMKMT